MKLLDVLKEYSPSLQGNGQVNCQCPFPENHSVESQKRKQMYLSPDINAYHCFSCGSKGRLVQLLTTKFEVPYFEAVEMVHIDTYVKTKKDDITDEDFFWVLDSPTEFLDRGFTAETLKKYKVGIGEKGEIVIPMYGAGGILKGLKYRISEPKRKFWYSKDFNKEQFIYNFRLFPNYVILVEGETDVWRLDQWRMNAYGMLGTGMSDWQAEQIAKTPKVYIASDTDIAGIKAANNWYKKLHKLTDVHFINYPAKDVGECTYREFKLAYNNPCNYAEFKILTGI